jgi:S1-C subfamily serine protease
LNDTEVESVSQFEKLVTQNAGNTVALLVRRGPNRMFVPLKISAGK